MANGKYVPRAAHAVALLTLAASGCVDVAESDPVLPGWGIVRTPAKGPLGGHPAFGGPLEVPGAGVDLIPFVMSEEKRWYDDGDHFAEGGSGGAFDGRVAGSWHSFHVRWHNAVVRVRETGQQWPLLDRRGVISRVWLHMGEAEDGRGRTVRSMLFAVTSEDTNGDGVLDDRDGARLVMAGPRGRQQVIVTPAGTDLVEVTLTRGRDMAEVLVREDRDGDGSIDPTDTPVPYQLDLAAGSARRVVDRETELAMSKLLL